MTCQIKGCEEEHRFGFLDRESDPIYFCDRHLPNHLRDLTAKPEPPCQRWEYMHVYVWGVGPDGSAMNVIEKLGKEGWELDKIVKEDVSVYVFKRPVGE